MVKFYNKETGYGKYKHEMTRAISNKEAKELEKEGCEIFDSRRKAEETRTKGKY